jgi:hypothetical protein
VYLGKFTCYLKDGLEKIKKKVDKFSLYSIEYNDKLRIIVGSVKAIASV